MAAASYDESVQDLQAFNGLVGQCCRLLHDESTRLQAGQSTLEDLGRDTQDALSGLQDALEDAQDQLQSAHEHAVSAHEDLSEFAQDAAGSGLQALVDDLETAGREVDSARETSGREQDDAFGRLESGGFDPQAAAVAGCEAGLEDAQTESHASCSDFDAALVAQGQQAAAAADDLEATLASAGTDTDGFASDLAAEAAEASRQWVASTDESLEAAAQSVAAALASRFEAFSDEVAGAAGVLEVAARSSLARAEQFAREDVDAAIAAAAIDLKEGPEHVLLQELDDIREVLEATIPLTEALATLSPELEIAMRVVAQVDQLLRELE